MSSVDLFLASQSPRRRELLSQLGVRFAVVRAPIDESQYPAEAAIDYVRRVAQEKALAGLASCGQNTPVLGADTAVVLQQRIFGKPKDRQQAEDMLKALVSRSHRVYSAVTITTGRRTESAINVTEVEFDAISESRLQAYLDTEEPYDKAGAYAIQGWAGQYIRRIHGSYSGVMGLPLYETAQLIDHFNLPLAEI